MALRRYRDEFGERVAVAGSFLDTTIVIALADDTEPAKTNSAKAVAANQPAEMPYYAVRELLTGRVRLLCETHNILLAATNVAEALLALSSLPQAQGRKLVSRIQALAESLRDVYDANPSGSKIDEKREVLQELAIRATRLWLRGRSPKNVTSTQPLACFNDGKITLGAAGELRGPSNSFNCIKQERCAAAAYLYDNKSVLTSMINALHPSALPAVAATKNENQARRKALKELQAQGPKSFNKNLCRALGDAYFAGMCPAHSAVLTTNVQDFLPLCNAVGKNLIHP